LLHHHPHRKYFTLFTANVSKKYAGQYVVTKTENINVNSSSKHFALYMRALQMDSICSAGNKYGQSHIIM
jgi:hypothetical protein